MKIRIWEYFLYKKTDYNFIDTTVEIAHKWKILCMEYRNKKQNCVRDICMPFFLFFLLFFLPGYLYGIASLWRCALNCDNNLELSGENVGGWHRPQRRLTGYLRSNKGLNYLRPRSVIFCDSRGRILGRKWDKSLKSFPPCYSVTSTNGFFSLPPPPLSKSGLKLVCNVNIVHGNLKTKIMPETSPT